MKGLGLETVGILKDPKWEAFAQGIDAGLSLSESYRRAGYNPKTKTALRSRACHLARRPYIAKRVEELAERRAFREEYSVEQALHYAYVSKLAIVQELKLIGFSNMRHYMRVLDDGEPVVDLSELEEHPDLWRAIKEIIVDEYTEGRGDNAREVKRTRLVLHDKRSALLDLAKMHRMIQNIQINNTNILNVNLGTLDAAIARMEERIRSGPPVIEGQVAEAA